MPRTLIRDILIVAVVIAVLLIAGCSHARYSEKYQRTPAERKVEEPGRKFFRVKLPDGSVWRVEPAADNGGQVESKEVH